MKKSNAQWREIPVDDAVSNEKETQVAERGRRVIESKIYT